MGSLNLRMKKTEERGQGLLGTSGVGKVHFEAIWTKPLQGRHIAEQWGDPPTPTNSALLGRKSKETKSFSQGGLFLFTEPPKTRGQD